MMSKKIFSKYSKKRLAVFIQLEKGDSFFSNNICFNSMLGDLGEAIALEYLTQKQYKIYDAEINFFCIENYNDIILPNHFLRDSAIKKYQKIDQYISEYYNVSNICEQLRQMKKQGYEFTKKDLRAYQEAKRLKVDNIGSKKWEKYPGRLDFVAEKDGIIHFFDAKVNTSQLNMWQRFRMLWLCKNDIPAKVIRIRLNFNRIDNQKENKNMIVRVPFGKSYTFGIIKKHLPRKDLREMIYLVDLPEDIKVISLPYSSVQIEKVCYNLEFENVEESKKIDLPTEKDILNIARLSRLYFGK